MLYHVFFLLASFNTSMLWALVYLFLPKSIENQVQSGFSILYAHCPKVKEPY